MWILGLAGSHNSGAALLKDGRVVVAVQAERLTRVKRQAVALERMDADVGILIRYCLQAAGIDLGDLSVIATSTPGRALAPAFALRPGASHLSRALPTFVTVPHHLAHAEYALHYGPPHASMVLVCDGSGSYETDRTLLHVQEPLHPLLHRQMAGEAKESVSAYHFDGRDLRLCYRLALDALTGVPDWPDGPVVRREWLASLGHLWEWAAWYCHGSRHEAGKVMGLAPFGDPEVHGDLTTARFCADGSAHIDYGPLARRLDTPNGTHADITGSPRFTGYSDVAAHVQQVTNRFLADLVRWLMVRHATSRWCYSGGVALNGIANQHLCDTLGIELHMNGSCEDNGTAIGAAVAAHHRLTGERVHEPPRDDLGREYRDDEIVQALRDAGLDSTRLPREELLRRTAAALAQGRVLGWFQGGSEFGPRALGHRSILADPRDPGMQRRLNEDIKRREHFRPYAPVVIERHAPAFFDLEGPSPLMLRVVRTRDRRLPAVTHVDGTARVQTVSPDQHPLLHDLLVAFEEETGIPVLLNTSFNAAGEPIVETPTDALASMRRCALDGLVIGEHLVPGRGDFA